MNALNPLVLELRLFIASDVSRLVGFCKGIAESKPIPGDEARWGAAIRDALQSEVARIEASRAKLDEIEASHSRTISTSSASGSKQ